MKFYTNVQLVGNQFLVRGYDNGEHFMHREEYRPTLYVNTKKKTDYKTLDGEFVEPIQPGYVRDCREFFKKYEDVNGFTIHGNERYIYQYISDKYPQNEIKFDISKIKLYTIDIETTAEYGFPDVNDPQEELLAITVQEASTKKIITWGVKPYHSTRKNFEYRYCSSEYELCLSFIQWWMDDTPEVITGWNLQLFDIPYIAGRLNRVLGEKMMKRLSPWGLVTQNETYIKGRKFTTYDIGGVTQLDYLDLYKKFTYTNQESYRLDHIALVELGQQKLDHSEFDTFKDFYSGNWKKFIDYNIVDVELVLRLEEKMKLVELAVALAYDAKVNMKDVYYQVRMWDTLIYNFLRQKNLVVPPSKRSSKNEKYAGAYVKEPIPGKYDWVVSFDLNSLYPHLIMQYNISPETLREVRHPSATVDKILNQELEIDPNYATCANGSMYRKDVHGFLPEMMQKIYDERVQSKKLMLIAKQEYEKTPTKEIEKAISKYNNIQMARKIQLNSAYGAIGNQYFRYYDLRNAEAITLSGQVSIRWIENRMNGYLNKLLQTDGEDYVIASDTDSIYLNLGPLVSKFLSGKSGDKTAIVELLDKICKEKLEPFIESSYQKLANYVAAYDQKMIMKRENIADRGIWTAKKRYILNVWDSEGVRYKEPKLKMMGIEAVKSSTPAPCRSAIKQALTIMMTKTEEDLISFIDRFKDEFDSLPPEDIAFPRSVNGLSKFKSHGTVYSKGCPIHVRGTLLYNFHVAQRKLEYKYPLVQEGEKIKFLYLRRPNKIGENVISFLNTFPRELDLEKSVDRDAQFKKAFLDPLHIITDVIGWKTEKVSNLEFLFA